MDNVSVKGKVIKIEPGAYYEGRTYDQYVFFEVAPGKIIDIFDFKMLLHPEWVGKDVSLTLLMFLSDIESIADEIYDIYPNPDEHRDPTSGGHCFSGRITAIDDNHKKLVVDIGVGSIVVDPSALLQWSFSIGEFIRICPSRVDLRAVIDHDSDHKRTVDKSHETM